MSQSIVKSGLSHSNAITKAWMIYTSSDEFTEPFMLWIVFMKHKYVPEIFLSILHTDRMKVV